MAGLPNVKLSLRAGQLGRHAEQATARRRSKQVANHFRLPRALSRNFEQARVKLSYRRPNIRFHGKAPRKDEARRQKQKL